MRVKVPAHTRNGVKVKHYVYTRKSKTPRRKRRSDPVIAGPRRTKPTAKQARARKILRRVAGIVAKAYRKRTGR